jgi:hypothetical protein
MDKKTEDKKSTLKSLITYLAITGGREKVINIIFRYAVLCNIFADFSLPNMLNNTK